MVEAVSQATVSYQDELWIGRTVSEIETFTQVLGVEEVSMPENVPDDVDVTHQQSPGRTKETIPGMLPSADYSQDLQFWPNDAGQTIIDELAALTEAGTPEYVSLVFVVGSKQRVYRGYVNSYTPTGTVGDKRMASMSAKIFNRLEAVTLPSGE
ncbi:hypothetical protein [Celeribacter sp.]|uniref:hypothetical protein n=1 Tax=Celeribacter sp. TaxID=1890673 RepID=UPI003A95A808